MRITQAHKEATRASLVQAGVHLFAENGFAETTLDQIAAAAGVARATFYNYFKSKEDVALAALEAVFDQVQLEVATLLDSPLPWRSKLMYFIECIVRESYVTRELMWVWAVESIKRGPLLTNSAQFHQMLADLFAAGQASGAVRTDRSPHDMAVDLGGIAFAQLAAWHQQGASGDLMDRLSAAVAMYLDGACLSSNQKDDYS